MSKWLSEGLCNAVSDLCNPDFETYHGDCESCNPGFGVSQKHFGNSRHLTKNSVNSNWFTAHCQGVVCKNISHKNNQTDVKKIIKYI